MEDIEIPSGSRVRKIATERGDVTLYWDKPSGGVSRYFIGLFFLAWMGGWFFGFKNALGQILNKPNAPNGFLCFWLVGWTVGGCFAAWNIFLIFRPQKPEKITFYSDQLEYDTGTTAPIVGMFNRNLAVKSGAHWSKFLQKRKVFPRIQKGAVRFVHEMNPSRIYFDWESKRYEIGSGLAEPEIDWIYSQLASWSK